MQYIQNIVDIQSAYLFYNIFILYILAVVSTTCNYGALKV